MSEIIMTKRDEHIAAISAAREEARKAGPLHRRDLMKHIHRMEKELRIYDRYQKATASRKECAT